MQMKPLVINRELQPGKPDINFSFNLSLKIDLLCYYYDFLSMFFLISDSLLLITSKQFSVFLQLSCLLFLFLFVFLYLFLKDIRDYAVRYWIK